MEEARQRILREVGRLTSSEITEIEQSLIDEGVSPDEIRRFCNVHALLFESALEKSMETPAGPAPSARTPGRGEQGDREGRGGAARRARCTAAPPRSARLLDKLAGVERHYELKENALFPYLEKHGFPGPSKVMWSKHNEVRALLKEAAASAPTQGLEALLSEVEGMIFKEENILFPAAPRADLAPRSGWRSSRRATRSASPFSGTRAFTLPWRRRRRESDTAEEACGRRPRQGKHGAAASRAGEIGCPPGGSPWSELTAILDALPVDITFVDADDKVKYFSQSKDRIFVRATSVLGRDVQNCHPPQSVDKVKRDPGFLP